MSNKPKSKKNKTETELIGYFNHRIMRHSKDFGLCELVTVYYDLDGTPTDYAGGLIQSVDPKDLYAYALEALEAFGRPVLDEESIDFSRSVLEKEDKMIGACHTMKMED